jgi:hypothetical protein
MLPRWDGVFALLGGHSLRLCRSPQVRIDGRTAVDVVVKRRQPRVHHRAVGRILQAP